MPKWAINLNLNAHGMYRLASRTMISQARTRPPATRAPSRYVHSAGPAPTRPGQESEATNGILTLADFDVNMLPLAESHGILSLTFFWVFSTYLLQAAFYTTRRMTTKSLSLALQLQLALGQLNESPIRLYLVCQPNHCHPYLAA
jgi:hypothetical protein